MRADQLKGHLDMLLLAVLSDGPLHGYAVIDQLRQQSGDAFDLAEGTVYPALHRLAKAGLLDHSWVTVGGRRRRVYRLSAQGGAALAEHHNSWRRFADAVARVVERKPWPDPA